MRGAALELVALSKRFGPTVAVDNINLKIAPGTYCCLLGPSGCGKTSTLRMIAGHEPVSSGVIASLIMPSIVVSLGIGLEFRLMDDAMKNYAPTGLAEGYDTAMGLFTPRSGRT